jgi:Protein of unknown function (DUF1091)
MRTVDYKFQQNSDLINVTFIPLNDTHHGEVRIIILKDLTSINLQVVFETPEQKFIDHTTNVCKWLKNRRGNFMVNAFMNYFDKHYNLGWFQCPLKKGSYLLAKPRENEMKADGIMPSIVPLEGNITFTMNIKAIIGKKIYSLVRTVEVIQFY